MFLKKLGEIFDKLIWLLITVWIFFFFSTKHYLWWPNKHKLTVGPLLTNIRWSSWSNNFEDSWHIGIKEKTKYVWGLSQCIQISLEHEERKKGLQPSTPPPHMPAVKDSMFIGEEKVKGEEVGTGCASSWGREGRGCWKRKMKNKIKKSPTASPQKTILQLLQNCIRPTFRIGREIQCLPYAGFFKTNCSQT